MWGQCVEGGEGRQHILEGGLEEVRYIRRKKSSLAAIVVNMDKEPELVPSPFLLLGS